jgi:hypothetical protein
MPAKKDDVITEEQKPLTGDQELEVRELIGDSIATFRNWALAIGSVVAAIVGIFGWRTFADVKESAQRDAKRVAESRVEEYLATRQKNLEEWLDQANKAKIKVSDIREEAFRLLGSIDEKTASSERQLAKVEELSAKVTARSEELGTKLDKIRETLTDKASIEEVAKLLVGDQNFRAATISVIEDNVKKGTRGEVRDDGTGYLKIGETLICWGRQLLELPPDQNNRNGREFSFKFAEPFDGDPTVATSVLTAGSPHSFGVYRWKANSHAFFGGVINHPTDVRANVDVTMEYLAIGRATK